MGYRLHYAQHYEPNWQGGLFGGRSEEFAYMVRRQFEQNHWMNEEESELELERADIEKYVKILMKSPTKPNKYFPAYFDLPAMTNQEVADCFKEILKSDDDTIHMEWF